MAAFHCHNALAGSVPVPAGWEHSHRKAENKDKRSINRHKIAPNPQANGQKSNMEFQVHVWPLSGPTGSSPHPAARHWALQLPAAPCPQPLIAACCKVHPAPMGCQLLQHGCRRPCCSKGIAARTASCRLGTSQSTHPCFMQPPPPPPCHHPHRQQTILLSLFPHPPHIAHQHSTPSPTPFRLASHHKKLSPHRTTHNTTPPPSSK